MMPVLSRAQIQALDRLDDLNQARVPGLVLMENAGHSAAQAILMHWSRQAQCTLVMCGTGNNGGDGFVVARHLVCAGCQVRVVALGAPEKLTADAAQMMQAWLGCAGQVKWIADNTQLAHLHNELANCHLVVDALFGTGLSKPLSGVHLDAVKSVNNSNLPCCALDIPSGIDADSGAILGDAVRAQLTVTFACPKLGHFATVATDRVGELQTVSLGIPPDSWERVGGSARRVEGRDVAQWMPNRASTLHKGIAGRVAIIAGSAGTSGAALLAARGALRAGAGLVTHVGYRESIDTLESRVLEAMTRRLDHENLQQQLREALSAAHAVVLGPGLGVTAESRQLVRQALEQAAVTVVIDADALTLLAESPEWLVGLAAKRILTPHVGELARLLNTDVATIESNRFHALSQIVAQTNSTIVLKGPHTLIGAPNMLPLVVGSPCPALATGGSGDVLAGMIGALSVSLEPWCAAACAVYWHNWAARRWSRLHQCDRGLLAHELADALPDALAELSNHAVPVSD